MKITFLPEALDYFNELSTILYEKEYFGFEESALNYVEDLFDDISNTLPTRQKKIAPRSFDQYGKDMYFSTFRKSKTTQWYVFFSIYKDNGESVYLVRHISITTI